MPTELYFATSRTSGKSYCGITSTGVARRWVSHCSSAAMKSPYRFHKAIRKYGPDDFELVVLFSYGDRSSAAAAESSIIAHLELLEHGYNMTIGGEHAPMLGLQHTTATRAKMSLSAIARCRSPLVRQQMRDNLSKTVITDETRRKISIAARKLWLDPNRRERMSVTFSGRQHTEEARHKMAAAKRGRVLSAETRERMSVTATARWARIREEASHACA